MQLEWIWVGLVCLGLAGCGRSHVRAPEDGGHECQMDFTLAEGGAEGGCTLSFCHGPSR
jgi:hypothetical protein